MVSGFIANYQKKIVKSKDRHGNLASLFVFTIFVLQIITALLVAQRMTSQWSELTVTWPYEVTVCSCEFMVVVLVKVCQLYMANISSRARKERYLWMTILLALPCFMLLCCSLIACRLVKVRVYNKCVWNLSQQGSVGYNVGNKTLPYVDTYQIISMTHYDTKAYVKTAWDTVQQKYQCCGSNAAKDWALVRVALPKSCCIDPEEACFLETAFGNGCAKKVNEILFEQLRYLEVTIFILMSFEFLMIVFVFVTIIGNRLMVVARRASSLPTVITSNCARKEDSYFLPLNTVATPIISGNRLVMAEPLG